MPSLRPLSALGEERHREGGDSDDSNSAKCVHGSVPKSFGNGFRFDDLDDHLVRALGLLVKELRRLSEGVSARLRRSQLMGRTITLRLRLSDFTTFTRRRTLPEATDSQEVIYNAAYELLMVELAPGRRFRLIGVGVTNFPRSRQLTLLS